MITGVIHQASGLDKLLDKRRKGLNTVCFFKSEVLEHACAQVRFHFVTGSRVLYGIGSLDDGKAGVDRVAEKNTGEAFGHYAGNPAGLDRYRRVFP